MVLYKDLLQSVQKKWYKKLCEAACCQSVNQETSTIEYEVVQ